MAGLGDSWGTEEELLHPRGPDGRWIRKAGIAKSIFQAVLGFLQSFSPRTFQNQRQSTQYLHNISRRQGKKRFGTADLRRLYDLPNANEDLRDGVIDNPSTGRFVEMMDRTETELPDDVILSRIVPLETFGYTAQTATGTNSETDPGIREMSGRLVADRGYSPMTMGNVDEVVAVPPGSVRMVVAAKKGTKVNIPGGSSSDHSIFLTRDQPLRITKIKPDGRGGWTMYVTTDDSRSKGETPEAIGGPRGLQVPPTQEREAAIRDLERISATREGRPDEVAEQADIEARRAKAEANAAETPVPSPAQEAERKRVEALTQQPAPGEPPPRTEPAVGRVGEPGAPAPGGAPTQAPEATVPSRAVDLRLAVRDAAISSPSAGSRRKQWNEAYLGVASGKKDPVDAVRELDSDIETLRRGGEPGGAPGRGGGPDEDRPRDIESFQKLRDLIAQEYGLPGAPSREERTKAGLPKVARGGKTRLSQRELEAEERNRAAGAAEAIPAPTPAKKAPAKKAAKKAAAGAPVRTKDQEDRILSQAAKLSGPPRNEEEKRLLDEAAAISTRRQAGVTARRQAGTSTEQESPAKALAKKAPVKKVAKRAAPGDDIDKMTKQQMLDELKRRGIDARKSWNKERLKDLLQERNPAGIESQHKEGEILPRLEQGARGPIKHPESRTPEQQEQRRREAEEVQRQAEAEQGTDLDKMTKRELIAEAGRRGVTARESWTKDRIKKEIRDREKLVDESDEQFRREMREELEAEFEDERQLEQKLQEEEEIRREEEAAPAPVKKAAKKAAPKEPFNAGRKAEEVSAAMTGAPGRERVEQGMKAMEGLNLTQLRQVSRELGIDPPRRGQKEGQTPESLREYIARNLDSFGVFQAPTPAPEPPRTRRGRAILGERPGAVPGAAPGTAAGKITAGRIQPGMRVLVTPGKNGQFHPSTRKTGQTTLTVERIERVAVRGGRRQQTRLVLVGRDENGNEIRTNTESWDGKATGVPSHQTFIVAPEPGAAPAKKAAKAAASDKVQVARERQAHIDRVKGYGDLGSEVDELIDNEASDKALQARVATRLKQSQIPEADQQEILDAFRSLPREQAREVLQGKLNANGVRLSHPAGAVVPLDRPNMLDLSGQGVAGDVDTVHVVRPGYEITMPDGSVVRQHSVVERATPEEIARATRAKQLVPEGSVAGPRTDIPVDNALRKKELRKALLEADLPPASPGSARKGQTEIKDDLVAGRITPEEAIRRLEAEIEFLTEDANEVDANRRQTELSDAEKTKLTRQWELLQASIDSDKKHSEFLRQYFKGEAPVVSIKEMEVVDPVSYEFLKDATPDDLKEAAKEAGLDAPSGDTPDEMFTDLLKQVARKALEEKRAKKKAAPAKKVAKKAAPAPAVPRDKERVDARLLAEGIEGLDGDTIQRVQGYLDGEEVPGSGKNASPAKIADWLNRTGRGIRDSAAIRFGGWYDRSNPDSPQYDPEFAEQMRLDRAREVARAQAYEELAGRVRGVRRKSVKKAAPAKVAPEVQVREEKIDDLKKRIIDQALEGLQGAKSRDKGDDALEGLTADELRRVGASMGVKGRSKRELRDKILDRFFPETPTPEAEARLEGRQKQAMDRLRRQSGIPTGPSVTLEQMTDLPSREAAHEIVGKMNKTDLLQWARELSIPGARSKNMTQLRQEIVEATTGRRLDSIATRGFTGLRPGLGDVAGRPDLPTVIPEPAAPRTPSLSRRASGAGIATPSRMFSDVDSAVSDADARLRNGESHTDVARRLRERAARVAKADIMEEGRRFPTELDRDTLLSIRKSNADYLRRVATHVQQEGKASKATPAKKAAKKAAPRPDLGEQVKILARGTTREERAGTDFPSPSRTGTSPVGGTKPEGSPLPDSFTRRTTDSRGSIIRRDRPNADEPLYLPNGGSDQGRMHLDSEFGELWQVLYQDDREPNSFVNEIARMGEQVGTGQLPLAQALTRLARMKDRATDQTVADRIQRAIDAMDAPPVTMPDLPDTVPESVREALRKLSDIPTARSTKVRGIGRGEPSVFDQKLDIIRRLEAGDEERRLDAMLRERDLHESVDGAMEMWRLFENIPMKELMQWRREAHRRAHPAPGETTTQAVKKAVKKATPRLTAIPGGGAGRGRGTRPKLTVVRNEEGEFAAIWV